MSTDCVTTEDLRNLNYLSTRISEIFLAGTEETELVALRNTLATTLDNLAVCSENTDQMFKLQSNARYLGLAMVMLEEKRKELNRKEN